MQIDDSVVAAAELFKALSSPLRLSILRLIGESPLTVGAICAATEQSQPLVSQHLRVLRAGGLVSVSRQGREAIYAVADVHVTHVIEDAVAHVLEPHPATETEPEPPSEGAS